MNSSAEGVQDQESKAACQLVIRDCGAGEYREGAGLAAGIAGAASGREVGDTVLVVEHPPVITLGAHKSSNKLLASPEELARRGIDLVEIRRGGGTTAHNPGQLVFYPILNLQELGLDINAYVRTLEQIGIDLLAGLGVESDRRKGSPACGSAPGRSPPSGFGCRGSSPATAWRSTSRTIWASSDAWSRAVWTAS